MLGLYILRFIIMCFTLFDVSYLITFLQLNAFIMSYLFLNCIFYLPDAVIRNATDFYNLFIGHVAKLLLFL